MQSDATGVACPNEKVRPCCLKFLFFFFFSEVGQGLFFWKSFWKSHSIYEWQVIISEPRGTNRTRPFSNSMIFFFSFFTPSTEMTSKAWKQGNGIKARKRHENKKTASKQGNSIQTCKQHESKKTASKQGIGEYTPQKLRNSHCCVPFTATFSKRRKIGSLWSERCDAPGWLGNQHLHF